MMRGSAALLFVVVLAQTVSASTDTVRYTNRSYIFATLDIPNFVTPSPQPDTFVGYRNRMQIIVNVEVSTPHYDDRSVTCGRGYLTYKLDRPRVFAYSCKIGPDIAYGVTKFGRTYRVGASDATEQIAFTINYPASQKRYWDPIVAHMTRSLRFAH